MTAHENDALPHFVMSQGAEVLYGSGAIQHYQHVTEAAEAIRSGRHPIVLGALPFNVNQPAALTVPRLVSRQLPLEFHGVMPAIYIERQIPSPEVHVQRVRAAVSALRDPADDLTKVVLARALELRAKTPLDPLLLTHRLIRNDPHAHSFCVDLSPAGPEYRGHTLVGCSPELLVQRQGDTVLCHPFAGSASRSKDPDLDRESGENLAHSPKNRHEHAVVIDQLRETLQSVCVDVQVPPEPTLSHTAALWHLSTPITAKLRDKSTTALDLALALHPTAAVCGTPTASATDLIARIEGQRGFYAGAVGWCDSVGNGRWVVAIRCAEISADGMSMRAFAGGGLVAESDPEDELHETTIKFRTILSGLGVGPDEQPA